MLSLLKELVIKLEAFQTSGKQYTEEQAFEAFVQFLVGDKVGIGGKLVEKPTIPPNETIDVVISKYLIVLNRYAKGYAKAMAGDADILSLEEFPYVAMGFFMPPSSKMDLISRNAHEKTTGMEILNRLVAKGYFTETANPADGRSKLLHITDAGKQAFFQSEPLMSQLAGLLNLCLNQEEKEILLALLHKLDVFHNKFYQEKTLPTLD